MFRILILLSLIFLSLSQVSANKKSTQTNDQAQQNSQAFENIKDKDDEGTQKTISNQKSDAKDENKKNDSAKNIQSRLIVVPSR